MYSIIRTDKLKTRSAVAGMQAHAEREKYVKNADPLRKEMNRTLIGDPSVGYMEAIEKRVADAGAKIRKNAVLGIDVFLGVSPEFFQNLTPDEYEERLQKWTDENLKHLDQEFGPGNTVKAVLHLDETTPHVQALVVPIQMGVKTKKGTRNQMGAKHWLDGPKKLRELHDRYAAAMKPFGLKRGIKGAFCEHTTIKEFYGTLERPIIKPDVDIETPPIMILKDTRENWSAEQAKKVIDMQREKIEKLSVVAKSAVVFKKRDKELRETLHHFENKNTELHKKLKDIPVVDILQKFDFVQGHKQDQKKWKGSSIISVDEYNNYWFDQFTQTGGSGSIDLVMHLNECDFKEAVHFLKDSYGVDAVAPAIAYNQKKVAEEVLATPKKPYAPPVPDPQRWPEVRKYLLGRGIKESIVDGLHKQGKLYANNFANVCMLGEAAAEKRSIYQKWRGLHEGSNKDFGGLKIGESNKKIVVVESGIEAMSYCSLRGPGDYMVYSTCGGCKPQSSFVKKEIDKGVKLTIAFNNDDAGHKMKNSWFKEYLDANIEMPEKEGFDWNNVLIEKIMSEEIARNEKAMQDSVIVANGNIQEKAVFDKPKL